MKLAVTPFNISSIKPLANAGADIFMLGNEQFANRLVYSFPLEELKEATNEIHALGKEIYINCNLIMHNDDILAVTEFLQQILELNVDGIIYGDIGVYMIGLELGITTKMIYNPETLNTNYFDSIYWGTKNIKGITISKEITLEDIILIANQKQTELSIVGHGYLNMFHSRRPLIENFYKYQEKEYNEYVNNRNLHLVEEIRNEAYPVFQDNHGTHIFREKIMQSFHEILTLSQHIDVFIIDGIFCSQDYVLNVVTDYHAILNDKDKKNANTIASKYKEKHDTGFLHKKTVYDKY